MCLCGLTLLNAARLLLLQALALGRHACLPAAAASDEPSSSMGKRSRRTTMSEACSDNEGEGKARCGGGSAVCACGRGVGGR